MARRRRSSFSRQRASLPKLQKATPVGTKPMASTAPNAQPSMRGGFLGALQNMGFYMMGSSVGRLQGENEALKEMVQDTPSTSTTNACANQLNEFVQCSQKYGDGAMCQQFADALSKCVTMHNPQTSSAPSNQFSSNTEGFSFT